MNILAWLVFGLIVGAITNFLDPQAGRVGLFGTILLGVLGALLGGFLGSLIFGVSVTGFNLPSFLVAIVGSLLLLYLERLLRRA